MTNLLHIVKAQNVLLFILDIVMRVYMTQEQKQQTLGTHAHQKKEVITMADRFPKNCWDKKCTHFHTRDLSIDDLVCTCDLLKIQCDACDEDFCLYLCPLQNETKERGVDK